MTKRCCVDTHKKYINRGKRKKWANASVRNSSYVNVNQERIATAITELPPIALAYFTEKILVGRQRQ